MSTLFLEKTGLFTSLQRLEPPLQVAFAVPFGGPMDRESARVANELVGNPSTSYVLEATLLGPTIRFIQACSIALTGADMQAKLDGQPIVRYQRLPVEAGQLLQLGYAKQGCRGYIAVGGHWEVDSKWTQFGTRPLPTHASLRIQTHQQPLSTPHDVPQFASQVNVPVRPGPEFERFHRAYIAYFFAQNWRVSQDSNRVGYRLIGHPPPAAGLTDILSAGIVPGTIQIPGNGQPILLLADAQTTGGYPRLVNVRHAALDTLGQLKPGDAIRFVFEEYADLAALT